MNLSKESKFNILQTVTVVLICYVFIKFKDVNAPLLIIIILFSCLSFGFSLFGFSVLKRKGLSINNNK